MRPQDPRPNPVPRQPASNGGLAPAIELLTYEVDDSGIPPIVYEFTGGARLYATLFRSKQPEPFSPFSQPEAFTLPLVSTVDPGVPNPTTVAIPPAFRIEARRYSGGTALGPLAQHNTYTAPATPAYEAFRHVLPDAIGVNNPTPISGMFVWPQISQTFLKAVLKVKFPAFGSTGPIQRFFAWYRIGSNAPDGGVPRDFFLQDARFDLLA